MDIQKKLSSIRCKQVFETGSEKQFIRAKDVAWLIETVEKQHKEIETLKRVEKVDNEKFGTLKTGRGGE